MNLGVDNPIYMPELRIDPELIAQGPLSEAMEVFLGDAPWPLLIFGPAGTGKTYLATYLIRRCGGGCYLYTVSEACEQLLGCQRGECYHGEVRMTTSTWWNDWSNAVCTVLDELGARQQVSDAQYECVKRSIDERERKAKPAIFISNKTPEELANSYDDRIASRLCAGTVIEMSGDDRRLVR